MRKHRFVEDNFYHIYIHAVGDMPLFRTQYEYDRFLLIIFLANGEVSVPRLDRSADLNLVWDTKTGVPLVKIVNFCLMSNHFHLTLGEIREGNISRYMHKILVSWAKYINKKYERRGHVFESNFHSRHLYTNEYLLRASAYIHLNPHKMTEWQGQEAKYPWSSYQDYTVENRWGERLQSDIVLSQFGGSADYSRFTEESRREAIDDNFLLT